MISGSRCPSKKSAPGRLPRQPVPGAIGKPDCEGRELDPHGPGRSHATWVPSSPGPFRATYIIHPPALRPSKSGTFWHYLALVEGVPDADPLVPTALAVNVPTVRCHFLALPVLTPSFFTQTAWSIESSSSECPLRHAHKRTQTDELAGQASERKHFCPASRCQCSMPGQPVGRAFQPGEHSASDRFDA